MPAERLIAAEGISNFRDFGGYPVAGGGRLVSSRLFRSGQHTNATQRDLEAIRDLGIRSLVDLRGDSERRKAPTPVFQSFDGQVLFAEGETAEMAPHVEAASTLNAEDARKNLRARYGTLPFRPTLVCAFSKYMHMLDSSDHPSVVFCSAGKDRTGVLVALVQTVLGVHPDDVMSEYLLSNPTSDSSDPSARVRQELTLRFGNISAEAVRTILSVEPAYLDAAFQAIKDRYATLSMYFDQVLGINASVRARIASKLVV